MYKWQNYTASYCLFVDIAIAKLYNDFNRFSIFGRYKDWKNQTHPTHVLGVFGVFGRYKDWKKIHNSAGKCNLSNLWISQFNYMKKKLKGDIGARRQICLKEQKKS